MNIKKNKTNESTKTLITARELRRILRRVPGNSIVQINNQPFEVSFKFHQNKKWTIEITSKDENK